MNTYRQEYIKRINYLQDYIEKYIEDTHTSEKLAEVSGFSKYHFHRIFKSITGESIFEYVTRTRLEQIASQLVHRPDLSITDIAYRFGFSDSAVFSRSFKRHYGIKPSEFRQKYSNNCKDSSFDPFYTKRVDSQINEVTAEVEIIDMDSFPVLYARKIGAYKELYDYTDSFAKAINDLFAFGMSRNLIDEQVKVLFAYHTYPDFSEVEKQRTSFCVSITEPVHIDNESEIGCMTVPAGKYAVGHFEIFQKEYPDAWNYLYGEWLPQSGYLPGNSFPFEVYLNKPEEHPQNKHIVDIYMPIDPFS
ncbi:AraC family transcriptional regulator [Candidatus Enterococcus clewellii]|uniref:AraC family transcriptional regulator n=1 Tax=Candidatus Enterococcus clewellii TaxID=1834193 RepID=A0A242K6M8_9ENTE|nr:GyrI-like domain-containing protein [Enterococcus sp. 9E7_DIV0242]OTP15971.1 hypothetical protein A5888_002185 [Enterococcus sp. 9E7_DIV0242]